MRTNMGPELLSTPGKWQVAHAITVHTSCTYDKEPQRLCQGLECRTNRVLAFELTKGLTMQQYTEES